MYFSQTLIHIDNLSILSTVCGIPCCENNFCKIVLSQLTLRFFNTLSNMARVISKTSKTPKLKSLKLSKTSKKIILDFIVAFLRYSQSICD